jgi:hypothetical protein
MKFDSTARCELDVFILPKSPNIYGLVQFLYLNISEDVNRNEVSSPLVD